MSTATEIADSLRRDRSLGRTRQTAYLLCSLIVIGLIWAHFAALDVVTHGRGQVIPSSQRQVVQSLDTGVIGEILVAEGDFVETGQVLLRIDNTGINSQLGEVRARYQALQTKIARLDAQLAGATELVFPVPLAALPAALLDGERLLFNSRRLSDEQALSVLRQQRTQRAQELLDLRSKHEELTKSHELARQELALIAPLAQKGIVSAVEKLRLDRELIAFNRELESARIGIPRGEAALAETEDRIRQQGITFRVQALDEINQARSQLAGLEETLRAASDRLNRTEVRAPVRGVINRLVVTTRGEVIQSGKTLVEITPADAALLIEARVRPGDVGFLRPGLAAMVKFTAYDFYQYGGMPGRIERISADTLTDERGESYYRVIVRTTSSQFGNAARPLPILPGMQATVDILTGRRTVLQYLAEPLVRVRSEAMSEP